MKKKTTPKLTERQRKLFEQLQHDRLSLLGSRGGAKRAENMTPKERKTAARKAVNARWARRKKAVAV